MTNLILILEFITVLAAHVAVGMLSVPLKYSKQKILLIWSIWVGLQACVLFVTENVSMHEPMRVLMGFVTTYVGQYAIFFATTRGSFGQRLFIILTYSNFFCIYMGIITPLLGSMPPQYALFGSLLRFVLLFSIVYFFLKQVCRLCREAAPNLSKEWRGLILVDIIFLLAIIASSVYPNRLQSLQDDALLPYLLLSAAIISVYPIVFSNIRNVSENAMKKGVEQQNKLLLAQIENENLRVAMANRARHDIRHHNLVLMGFVKQDDMESIRQYLDHLVADDMETAEKRYCRNATVHTVLSVYGKKAEQQGIPLRISASAGEELAVSPQDLVAILANLFENAVHGAAKEKEPFIRIDIREGAQRLLIRVENRCRSGLFVDESMYGIGMNSIITAAQKYEGMVDFFAEDGVFTANINLNLKEK